MKIIAVNDTITLYDGEDERHEASFVSFRILLFGQKQFGFVTNNSHDIVSTATLAAYFILCPQLRTSIRSRPSPPGSLDKIADDEVPRAYFISREQRKTKE